MPPINKRPKTSIPGLPTGPAPGVQDYRDPFKKTILNPEPLNPMELVLKQQRERTVAKAAQAGATGKQRKAGAKAVRVLQQTQKAPTAKALERMRIVEEGEAALRYNLNDPLLENVEGYRKQLGTMKVTKPTKTAAAPGRMQLLNRVMPPKFEKLKEVRSEMDRQYYQDQVENGPLLAETSPLVRGFDRAVVATTKTIGQLFQDVFGSDEGSTVLGDVGKYIASLGEQAEGELAQFHQYEKPKEQKSIYERSMEFLGSAPVSLVQFAAANAVAGPVLGFGALRVEEARSRGERNSVELTKEFAFGAATGALLQGLGKTADVVGRYSKVPGISTLAKAPRLTQAGAQFIGGAAQTYGETFLAKDTDIPPDGFDYLAGGLFNVALDPVVFGPSPKAKKATAIAVESTAKWANDQIPPSGLAELRDDFWQPMDVPWSEKVTADLLKRARAQFVEAPGEPEGTLFVNPQAAMILQRLGESLDNPSARVAASTSQGTSLTTEAAQLLSARARAKTNEVKQVVAQLPNGHEKLIPYAESAVMYESLADTLDAATAGNRPLNMRFIRQSDMTDPTNPTAVKWSDKVIGHESWHAQDHKTAASVKANWNTLTDPLWLMEHPLGAKLFSTMGDEGNPLGQTGAEHLTGEALAYAAQPGESPIGLTTQERGILVGDYLAHLQDKYGGGILAQRYAGRIDREVAKVAFRRLYEAGRVGYKRDANGKAIGLEWPDILPPMNWKIPGDPLGEVMQAPLSVDEEQELKAPTWYSSLERFIEGKVRGSAPANQLLAMIKNGNLRPGELEWTGILDWLGEKGNRKVSRDEVLTELEGRRVDVQEVWKGVSNPGLEEKLRQEEFAVKQKYGEMYSELYSQARDIREKQLIELEDELDIAKMAGDWELTDKLELEKERLEDVADKLEREYRSIHGKVGKELEELKGRYKIVDPTKYGPYVQKGESENYRELLLTLPPTKPVGLTHAEAMMNRMYGGEQEEGVYRSPHWEEPNILAHIRMTDRRASDGGKVLFIEELQSDWHQYGSKKGYGEGAKSRAVAEVDAEIQKVEEELRPLKKQLVAERFGKDSYSLNSPLGLRVGELKDKLRSLQRKRERAAGMQTVPDAPFKKTWPELAMRRMIRYAAENGYDRVAWVKGEQADNSVGGNSAWFYDRNLINDTNKILKKWGVSVRDGSVDPALEAEIAEVRKQRDALSTSPEDYAEVNRLSVKLQNLYQRRNLVFGHEFPITPEMKRSVIKEGQPMPLSIEPSDTHETSPIDDTSDDTVDNLDETRQINVNTVSTEQKERYDSLMAEQTKARNAHKDLARQLRFAKKEIDYYTELQRNSGVDHSDTIKTTRRYAEDLARRVAAAKVELNESAARTNEFRDSLVAELGENVVFGVAPDLAQRAKALKRLQDIANEIPADGDLQQMVVAATKMYAFDRVMTDTLTSLGPQWNPSRFPDVPLSDLFYQAVAAGKADIELFTKVLDANSLTLNEFNDLSRETMRTAARLMSSKSRAKRILNKMFRADAEFQDWFDKSVPTVRELQALARGRSNIQRVLHLGQSLLLVQPATMAMNAVGGGVNTGLRVYLNTFNAGLQKLLYNTRAQATYRDADFVEQPIIPSSFTEIIAPLRELWGVFGYGKELGKPIPPLQVQLAKNKNIARLQKLIEAFPEVEGKMLAPLEADVESVGTEREKQQIEIWNKQIALLPEGPKKRRLAQELAAAEKRAISEQTKISTMLRGGEAFVHKMLRLNRAQEQFFRTGIFLGQLDNYAKNQGIDLAQLESNNALSELPDDIVNRAMNDALEMTYGNRPSPKARPGSFDSLWYSTTRFMNDKLISGTLVYFPNFMVNFLRQHLELNPLTGLRLFRAMHRAEYEQGNYDAIGKSVFGAMALGAANLIRSSRYDEEEGKKNLNEVGNWPGGTEWYSVGGVDMRSTPFAPFLLMADMYQRNKRGLPQQVKTLGEIARAFGAEQRNLTGMADWLDKALSQLNDGSITNADKLKATTGSAIGEWISHFATPMQLITDLVSIFDKDQRKLKDTRGMFQGAILDPSISKIPYLRDGLPDRIDPLTGRPMVNADSFLGPVTRQTTGFRLIPDKSYVGQVFSTNGVALKDWIPFTGIPEVDRDLVSEIAKNVNKMTERYETADIRNRPVDEQVAEMYADYKTEAVAALSDVLGTKYPELEEMMLEKQELNLWERRVEERKRRQAGLPSAEEIYSQRKQQRIERQGK